MPRRVAPKEERDVAGRTTWTRVHTRITTEHYRWVSTQRGAQFGAILDRAIEALMTGDDLPDSATAEQLGGRAFRAAIAARSKVAPGSISAAAAETFRTMLRGFIGLPIAPEVPPKDG